MRRRIDPSSEAAALELLAEEVEDGTVDDARNGRLGAQSDLLDLVSKAMSRGARAAACAEVLGLSPRTVERWRQVRARTLHAVDDLLKARSLS